MLLEQAVALGNAEAASYLASIGGSDSWLGLCLGSLVTSGKVPQVKEPAVKKRADDFEDWLQRNGVVEVITSDPDADEKDRNAA